MEKESAQKLSSSTNTEAKDLPLSPYQSILTVQFAHALSELKHSSVPGAEAISSVYAVLGISPGAASIEIEAAFTAILEALESNPMPARADFQSSFDNLALGKLLLEDLRATLSNSSRRVFFDNILRSLSN